MTTELEEQIRDELRSDVERYVPSTDLVDRAVARLGRRRRRQRTTVLAGVSMVVVIALAVVGVEEVTTESPAAVHTVTAAPNESRDASDPLDLLPPGSVAPPETFFAARGAGDERPVILRTTTGEQIRSFDAAPAQQLRVAMSPDRRTIFVPTQSGGCGGPGWVYAAYDIATGRATGTSIDLSGRDAGLVTPGSDGATVAYAQGCPVDRSPADGGSITIDGPSGATDVALVGGVAMDIEWSARGDAVAYELSNGTIEVYSLAVGETTTVLRARGSDCRLAQPRFSANDQVLSAVELCLRKARGERPTIEVSLTTHDRHSGRSTATVPLLSGDVDVNDHDVDPSGRWVLVSFNRWSDDVERGEVLLVDLRGVTAARSVLSDAYQVRWLP